VARSARFCDSIPTRIVSFDDLGLPKETAEKISDLPKGLVLVTAATGSGKSTTLASMIDCIDRERPEHIVTIEDPIEFIHKNKRALFATSAQSDPIRADFKKALRAVLRQDPDVVMIGELRDLETVEAALTLAETGHLTFATLHTSGAAADRSTASSTSSRPTSSGQIRSRCCRSRSQAVLCQQRVPQATGQGPRARLPRSCSPIPPIRALIRDSKAHPAPPRDPARRQGRYADDELNPCGNSSSAAASRWTRLSSAPPTRKN
jgi:twitching motility protein PilT